MTLGRTNINLPEIKIPPKALLLYNYGDECAENSGGWEYIKCRGGLSSLTSEKQEDCLYSYGVSNTSSYTASFGWSTVDMIDVTTYTKLKAIMLGYNQYENKGGISVALRTVKLKESITGSTSTSYAPYELAVVGSTEANKIVELEIDISNINQEAYVQCGAGALVSGKYGMLKVYKVWLEP